MSTGGDPRYPTDYAIRLMADVYNTQIRGKLDVRKPDEFPHSFLRRHPSPDGKFTKGLPQVVAERNSNKDYPLTDACANRSRKNRP